jgi:hypothetical protein
MPDKPQKVHGIANLIATLGQIADEQLNNAQNKEEYAYIFGHIHCAALLISAIDNPGAVKVSFNYKIAHEAYLEAAQEYENNEKESEEHQLSMEELYPEIFKAVDAYLSKKNKKKNKE